jgi:signal transduction histidine kinase
MRIGTRIAITTVALVTLTLGLYGYVTVRVRRAELAADLERQTGLVGSAVQVAFEAALQDGLFEDVTSLIRRWQAVEPNIGLVYIDFFHSRPGEKPPGVAVADGEPASEGAPDETPDDGGVREHETTFVPPPPDATRAERFARIEIDGQPAGAHIRLNHRPTYALTVPIRDAEHKIVAAIELTRDESDAERALAASVRAAIFAVGGLSLGLALLVWGLALGALSPLKRLLEAIDDVTQGDLGRVILRERDDEVGELADRFNQMTGSLREARQQILDGVEAKLSLEARLRHSEKLATIGQLAAGIAHEVGTPLNVIGGRARGMEKKAAEAMRQGGEGEEAPAPIEPADVAKNAAIIATQTQRITRIIQQLLDFARRTESARGEVDLEKVARETLDFLEHQLAGNKVAGRLRPFAAGEAAPQRPLVQGDADQLQQVCLNLCINALQAMPGGGDLEVSTRSVVRRRPGLETAAPGRFVVLEISDTGVGIPAGDRERIFEPFYSTKHEHDGGGTGLGLAVSHGIVKDHDGFIEIDDRPGGGTIFRVYLPERE